MLRAASAAGRAVQQALLLGLERAEPGQDGVDEPGAGHPYGRRQRGAQPGADLQLGRLGGVDEALHEAGARVGSVEISAVVREDGVGHRLRGGGVGCPVVGVVVQQQLEVLRQPGRQPASQRLGEVHDGQLQLGGQVLAVDRLRPEAGPGLAVDHREQDHPAVLAGLPGQRRHEGGQRQGPGQRLVVGEHAHGDGAGRRTVGGDVDPHPGGVQPVAHRLGQEGVQHDRRLQRAVGVRVQHRAGRAGVHGRGVLLGHAHAVHPRGRRARPSGGGRGRRAAAR